MGLISRVSSRTYRHNFCVCIFRFLKMLRRIVASTAQKTVNRSLATTAARKWSLPPMKAGMSHDQRVTAWVDYFDHPECDMWYFARGNNVAVNDDWIPPPEVWQAMLYCCRRNSCLPSAIRVLEQLKWRCRDNRDAFFWILQELEPTIKDLGMEGKTPEDLGFYDRDVEYNTPKWNDY